MSAIVHGRSANDHLRKPNDRFESAKTTSERPNGGASDSPAIQRVAYVATLLLASAILVSPSNFSLLRHFLAPSSRLMSCRKRAECISEAQRLATRCAPCAELPYRKRIRAVSNRKANGNCKCVRPAVRTQLRRVRSNTVTRIPPTILIRNPIWKASSKRAASPKE